MSIDLKSLTKDQLADLIKRAERRRTEIEKEHLLKVRDKILATLKAEGYTLEELFEKTRRTRRPAAQKYRNPDEHSQTWSGRGKHPKWFQAALKSGKKAHDLLIKN
jgi:DNA-binding protein H-NS